MHHGMPGTPAKSEPAVLACRQVFSAMAHFSMPASARMLAFAHGRAEGRFTGFCLR
jgi:hypothetical protein